MKIVSREVSFRIFNAWITNAKRAFPNLNYQIKDLEQIEIDVSDAILKALESLQEKYQEKDPDLEKPGFGIGFLAGFIQGHLKVQWYSEYIYKQTDIYKTLKVVVAIDSFLKLSSIPRIQMKAVYKEEYTRDINLENPDINIQVSIPSTMNFLDKEGSDDPILAGLENLKILLTKNFLDNHDSDFLPSILRILKEEEIQEIWDNREKYLE